MARISKSRLEEISKTWEPAPEQEITWKEGKELVKDLRDAIATLALNRNKLLKLSEGALARARFFLWSNNGERMAEIYGQALIAANQTATKSAQVVRDIVHAQ